jgi:hypothetical protein
VLAKAADDISVRTVSHLSDDTVMRSKSIGDDWFVTTLEFGYGINIKKQKNVQSEHEIEE